MKLGVGISILLLIVFVAFYPYPRSSQRLYYIPDYSDLSQLGSFGHWVLKLITNGGGNVPNIAVIIIYCAV